MKTSPMLPTAMDASSNINARVSKRKKEMRQRQQSLSMPADDFYE
jgi:hypothetical protein